MRHLILYSTLGCHLCEQAKALVEPILVTYEVPLTELDIADSDELIDTYGVRIPVLRDPDSNAELGWPFGPEDLIRWIGE